MLRRDFKGHHFINPFYVNFLNQLEAYLAKMPDAGIILTDKPDGLLKDPLEPGSLYLVKADGPAIVGLYVNNLAEGEMSLTFYRNVEGVNINYGYIDKPWPMDDYTDYKLYYVDKEGDDFPAPDRLAMKAMVEQIYTFFRSGGETRDLYGKFMTDPRFDQASNNAQRRLNMSSGVSETLHTFTRDAKGRVVWSKK